MKRAIVIARGEVRKVNYRDAVEEIARKLKLTGFVENLKPYDVRIVAEGEDEQIDLFIERIKINKFPIDVEGIEVRFEAYKGEFEYFEIKRGEWGEEIAERLDTAGKLLYRSVELGERSVELSERSVELGERSVELGERSVGLGEESVKIGRTMLGKQDETISITKTGVDEMRESREENKTLLLDFHHDTVQRFDSLDVKYGKITGNMEKLVQSVDRTSKNTERLLESADKDRKEFRDAIKELTEAILKFAEKA
jgi:acylphosphatase